MSVSGWVRQVHRWLSIVFTATVIAITNTTIGKS